MNVASEQLITDSEAKQILEKKAKDGELKYEQNNAYNILKKTIKIEPEKIELVIQELKNMEKLRERQVITIANFLPDTKDELRAILHKEYNDLSEEDVGRILEIIKKTV